MATTDSSKPRLPTTTPSSSTSCFRINTSLLPSQTIGNADQISLVITNLLTNAIHYNKRGGEVTIITAMELGDAILTVSDTGQGIADIDLQHIFNRFYRADKSRSRADGRNGLGLAICKTIVAAHGGIFSVKSTLDVGSRFTIRLIAEKYSSCSFRPVCV